MPRLNSDDTQVMNIAGSNFSFSGTRINHLTATEYTLATIAIDESSSVASFKTDLEAMLTTAILACKRSPRSDNILIRVVTFSSKYPSGINEIHGFRPLTDVDASSYVINPGGMTPLNDAVFTSIGATNAYAAMLSAQDYNVNAIFFVITDGQENASTTTAHMVWDEFNKAMAEEKLESVLSILIGVNFAGSVGYLTDFQRATGMTQFIDAGSATPQSLAGLALFVSKSISSQSQSLGSGGPSQNIPATI